jgi:hypothetical protein
MRTWGTTGARRTCGVWPGSFLLCEAFGHAAGVLGGVAVANRPQPVLNLAVLVVPLLFRLRRQAMASVGIVAGTALILGGTVLHNSVATDKLTGLSENAGIEDAGGPLLSYQSPVFSLLRSAAA